MRIKPTAKSSPVKRQTPAGAAGRGWFDSERYMGGGGGSTGQTKQVTWYQLYRRKSGLYGVENLVSQTIFN
jgi:hypothetical protein